MRIILLALVLAACGPTESTDVTPDAGTDAGTGLTYVFAEFQIRDAGPSPADVFRRDVEPVLRARGCVDCHVGSAHDWTGPDLHASVLAYRPRMIDPENPAASTMLGKGFYSQNADGGEYAAALAWIAME